MTSGREDDCWAGEKIGEPSAALAQYLSRCHTKSLRNRYPTTRRFLPSVRSLQRKRLASGRGATL